jgi:hypothetical protein
MLLRQRRRLRSMVLRGALFIDALLRFLGFALAFLAALLGFHHVLTQLTVSAEEAPIRHYKLRFFLFFRHSFLFATQAAENSAFGLFEGAATFGAPLKSSTLIFPSQL